MTEEWWRKYKDNKKQTENKIFGHVESELKRRFKSEKTPDDMYSICKTDNNYWKHYRASENLDTDAVSLVLCKDTGCDLMYCQALTMKMDNTQNLYGCTEQYHKFRECYVREKRRFNASYSEEDWLKDRNIIPNYIEKQLLLLKEQKERIKTYGDEVKVIKVDESKIVKVPKEKIEEGYFD